MKTNYLIAVFSLSLAVLAGCDRQEKPPVPHDTVSTEDVKHDARQAARTTGDYLNQEKDEFLATTDKKLKEFDGKIDDLAKRSSTYKDDAKVQADQALASLREQRGELAKKYDQLKASTKDAWVDTKAAFVSAWDKIQQGFEDAKSKFQ